MSTNEPPPSYEAAASGAGTGKRAERPQRQQSTIPVEERRSMEDSIRPLPQGWVRQWDPKSNHNFFVDTTVDPVRSIWSHPLDDEEYVRAHPDEAKRLNAQGREGYHPDHPLNDETTDEEGDSHHPSHNQQQDASSTKPPPSGMKKLGQTMKNKMTGSTHAERVEKRRKQRELEEKAYKQHQIIRAAMVRATQTGQPQLVGRDKHGRDIFAQPPPPNAPYAGANLGYAPYQTAPHYPYGGGAYPAPYGPYRRRAGYGYGGGMGMPLMGGMMGGMLLGGLMF